MERAFTPEEDSFFEANQKETFEKRGIVLTSETTAELEERSIFDEPFPKSCSPAWFTKERAAWFAAFLAGAAGVALSKAESVDETEGSAEMSEGAQESIKRIHAALEDAARDVRADKSLLDTFSPGEIEIFAETLETYPVETFFAQLSEMSGIPQDELAIDNKVRFVSFNTDDTASNFISYLQTEHPGEVTTDVEKRAAEEVFSAAALNRNRSAVFLNLSQLKGDTITDMQWNTRDVLTHELLHGQVHDQFTQATESSWGEWYEGSVELGSNKLMPMMWGQDAPKDPFAGYLGGGTVMAEVLLNVMEPMDYWQGIFKNDPQKIQEAFDVEFGYGAFSKALSHGKENPYAFLSTYRTVAPLMGLIDTIESQQPERVQEILQAVNAERRTGKVYRFQDQEGGWSGTFLLTDEAETGIAKGVLEHAGSVGNKVVFFSAMQDEGVGSFYIPNSLPEAAFVFHNIREQDGIVDLDTMDAGSVQECVQGLVSAHAEQLALFAETEIH